MAGGGGNSQTNKKRCVNQSDCTWIEVKEKKGNEKEGSRDSARSLLRNGTRGFWYFLERQPHLQISGKKTVAPPPRDISRHVKDGEWWGGGGPGPYTTPSPLP